MNLFTVALNFSYTFFVNLNHHNRLRLVMGHENIIKSIFLDSGRLIIDAESRIKSVFSRKGILLIIELPVHLSSHFRSNAL